MYIKNKSGHSTDPCRTPDIIFLYSDVLPFKTTLCSRFSQFLSRKSSSPSTP